jgi:lipopolysaccharide transport system ATP-binding protein
MHDVSKEGRTVLFVSHDMGAIRHLCDRVAVLDKGEVVFDGDTDDAIQFYLSTPSKNGSVPINERTDRSGTGSITITKIDINNSVGEKIDMLFTGNPATFNIYYSAQEKIQNVAFRIQIFDSIGNLISTFNNFHTAGFFTIEGAGYVKCHIPKVPLLAGEYRLDIRVQHDFTITDELESAIIFSVENGDFFGTGKTPTIKQGVLINHEWNQ